MIVIIEAIVYLVKWRYNMKKNKKRRLGRNKLVFILIAVISVFVISIAYAALTTTLKIEGSIDFEDSVWYMTIDVPNVDLNEIFPMHQPEEIIPFGKYKGKSLQEIYDIDPKYIFWLLDQDPYYTVNIPKLIGVEAKTEEEFQQICLSEYDRLYPKLTAESIIKTGNYKDKSFAEVALDDPNYIDWFLANTKERIDYDSFYKLKQR
jgi:uncharacterized protein (DUF3820 family)